jgi:serine/threonine protein kinase
MGTLEYAPCEQYGTGVAHTDARSDIYSLGATLYHLLTGRAPVPASQRLLDPAALPAPRTINARIPMPMEQVILKAMEIDLQRRFQTALEMKQVLLIPTPPVPQVPVTIAAAPMHTQQIVVAYCVKERKKRQMKDAKRVVLKNGRPAMQGICTSCGTKMTRFIKN